MTSPQNDDSMYTSEWNDYLNSNKKLVDKLNGWWIELVDEMTDWWNDGLMKWRVDEMMGWWNDGLMKWLVDERTNWWKD
jgi:hypothetical protein